MDIFLILMLLTSTAEPQCNTSHYNSILDIMLFGFKWTKVLGVPIFKYIGIKANLAYIPLQINLNIMLLTYNAMPL